MREAVRRVAVIGAVGLAVAMCGREEPASTPLPEEQLVRVSGSDDVYPLVQALAAQFEEDHDGFRIVFAPPTHTRGGAAGVSLGEADVGLLSRPLSVSEKDADTAYLHLAQDMLIFATHRDVGVDRLTRRQLIGIYRGEIVDWSEVGGKHGPITVLDRAEHTSLKVVLRQQLLGDSLVVTPSAIVLERPDDVLTSLATVENSIGCVSFGNAFLADLSVGYLTIDGARPLIENLQTGAYPYSRPFGLLVGPTPDQSAMRFVKFIYGEKGRQTIASYGFAPVTMDLIIAVLPEQDLLAQEKRYAPLVEHLSQELGIRMTVKLRLLPNYGAVIQEFREGRVNAAFLGSLAFALAHAQAGVEPIARPERDGVSEYHGLIVTRRDSGIRKWSDLRGKSFGLVDRATTAGHLFPLIYLRERDVALESFVGSVVYTGSHDLLFLKVASGELDAGAAKDLMLDEVARTRPEIKRELRTLAISPPLPNNTFVLGGDLEFPCYRCHELVPSMSPGGGPREPSAFQTMLTDVLLGLHDSPGGREVLESLGADRFVRTTDEDLREVDRMIEQAGFDPKDYRP